MSLVKNAQNALAHF